MGALMDAEDGMILSVIKELFELCCPICGIPLEFKFESKYNESLETNTLFGVDHCCGKEFTVSYCPHTDEYVVSIKDRGTISTREK